MNGNGQGDLFDGFEGLRRKREGMRRVELHNADWQQASQIFLYKYMPFGWRGLPEDWRYTITDWLGPPTNEHAWGPLTTALWTDGLVRRTGRRYKMKSPKSNARDTAEYERPDPHLPDLEFGDF